MRISDDAKMAIGTMLIATGGFVAVLEVMAGVVEQALWPYLPAAAAGMVILSVGMWIGFEPIRRENLQEAGR